MYIFLSWAGERSTIVAEALCRLIQTTIPTSEPWVSSQNKAVGEPWQDTLFRELRRCDVGIFCVTQENLESKWIHFEAGAIAKRGAKAKGPQAVANPQTASASMRKPKVIPYLLDVEISDVGAPLNIYPAQSANKQDTKVMLQVIHNHCAGSTGANKAFERLFERHWPEFEARIKEAREYVATDLAEHVDHVQAEELRAQPAKTSWSGWLRWTGFALIGFGLLAAFLVLSLIDYFVSGKEPESEAHRSLIVGSTLPPALLAILVGVVLLSVSTALASQAVRASRPKQPRSEGRS